MAKGLKKIICHAVPNSMKNQRKAFFLGIYSATLKVWGKQFQTMHWPQHIRSGPKQSLPLEEDHFQVLTPFVVSVSSSRICTAGSAYLL